jgi:GntR family transcriptional regulator
VPGARTGESAYSALARELRNGILQGRYAEGQQLPTEAELTQRRNVSRQTVRRAFHDLVSEGMVHRVPGRGTFVASRGEQYLRQFGSIEDLMALSVDTELELLTPLQRRVDIDAASRLRLDTDVVASVCFRRLHEGVPFCETRVFLPPHVGERLESVPELTEPGARSPATVIGLLDTRIDTPIAEAQQSITAERASPGVASHLGVEPGDPVLRIDRSYHDASGDPVELAISYFAPEHYSYRVRLRRTVR